MDRRAFLAGGISILAAPLAVEAQPAGKVYRIGFLAVALPRSASHYQAFEQALRELGYVEGRNLGIDFRTAEGRLDRLPGLAAELVSRGPDVLVAVSTPGAMAAKGATRTTPIIMAGVGDPLGTGLVTWRGRAPTSRG